MKRRIAAVVAVGVWLWWPSSGQLRDHANALSSAEPAQIHSGYPSQEEVMSSIREADAALRRFEMTTDRITFAQWNAPYVVVNSAREGLSSQREDMQRVRRLMERLRTDSVVSTYDLFYLFGHLAMDSGMASDLGHDVSEYQHDDVLSTELLNTSTEITRVVGRLEGLMFQQISAQEAELQVCRSRH